MSDTDTTDESTTEAPVATAPPAKKLHLWRWLAGFTIVGAVLGFAGGLTSHALFPVHNGKNGAAGVPGAQGPAGEQGPKGPAGAAGKSTDLGIVGYCLNVQYQNSPTLNISYVSSVALDSPVVVNSTQTCPNGSFVPLQPSTQNTATPPTSAPPANG
jgi:hypothetical protein